MKREHKSKIFAIFIIIIFTGSAFAYAIMSAFSTEGNEEAIVVFNIRGDDQSVTVKFSEGESLGVVLERYGLELTNDCFQDYCNGEETLKFYVNRNENNEFQNYIVRNSDVILIDFN